GPPRPRSLRVAKPRCARCGEGPGELDGRAPGGRAAGPPAPPLASRGEAALRSLAVTGRGNWTAVHREDAPRGPPHRSRLGPRAPARMPWGAAGSERHAKLAAMSARALR